MDFIDTSGSAGYTHHRPALITKRNRNDIFHSSHFMHLIHSKSRHNYSSEYPLYFITFAP